MPWKQEGETVTLTMPVADWELMLVMLGWASTLSRNNQRTFWRCIALVNRINIGNPDFTPYEIPEEYR
jgi:hypothetical protein